MNVLYTIALVVGVGIYLLSLFSDLDHHVEVGGGGHGVDHDSDSFRILSIRNATYFLFAFGVSGVALRWLWGGDNALLTAAIASGVGVAGGAISALTFGWMKRTESGNLPTDSTWVGLTARVTIPLASGSTGKILVSRGGREHELLARPFEPDAQRPERWTDVMVIEMQHGVALVAPGEPVSDDPLRIAPPSES